MIGQKNLISKLNSYDFNTFPHSLMLIGSSGSGKHTFISDHISMLLNIPVIDITDKLTLETIQDITLSSEYNIYLIDCDKITVKEQNVILKFLEEPVSKAFIVLITSNPSLIIDTVMNRCQIWKMEKYSKEELLNFTSDENILKIADTPGQIINFENCDVEKIQSICNKLFTVSHKANLPNLLSISNGINWGKDSDKINFNIFCHFLIQEIYNLFSQSDVYLNCYLITKKLIENCNVLHVDKQRLFEQYLINIKMEVMKIYADQGTEAVN